MTVSEFKQIAPEQNSINILHEKISGLYDENIYSTTDLTIAVSSSDYTSSNQVIASGSLNDRTIADADSFSIVISGSKYNATILEKQRFIEKILSSSGDNHYALTNGDPYYYIKFTPINFTGNYSDIEVLGKEIDPSTIIFKSSQLDTDFRVSEYNALDNNADRSTKDQYIQKVDRSRKQVNPVNLSAILSDVAPKADSIESNYTATGLVNSKYKGSKTDKAEYGTFPAIGAVQFEGALYTNIPTGSSQQQDAYICSQSVEDRNYKTLLFSVNRQSTSVTQGDGITDASLPRIRTTRLFFSGSKVGDTDGFSAPSGSQKDFAVSSFIDIKSGDILAFSFFLGPAQTTVYENVLVESVEFISESLNGPIIGTSGSVQRGYLSDIDSVSTEDGTKDWSATSVFSIHKYTPDIIYELNGNVPYRIVNKRLYLRETGEVFYVDERGQVLAKTIDC